MAPRKLNPATCTKRGHLWKTRGRSRDTVEEYCARCPESRDRSPTTKEKKAYRAWAKKLGQPSPVHKLAHQVDKSLGNKAGYEAMLVMDKLAKKNPERIITVGVDDSHHSSSQLAFVTHEAPSNDDLFAAKDEPFWHGVSVYYVPQCSGEDPIQFFLYPRAVNELLKTLQKLKKRMLTFPEVRREQRDSAQCRKEIAYDQA